jgi:hypothetical protein
LGFQVKLLWPFTLHIITFTFTLHLHPMPPPALRTGGLGVERGAAFYYAQRVRAQSRRQVVSFETPAMVRDPRCPRKEEPFSTRLDVLGPLVRDHYPVVPYSSQRNLLAAFDKRSNFYTNARADRSIIKGSIALLHRLAPSPLDPLEWTPELFHEWNAQFPAEKQARHLNVLPMLSAVTSKQFSDKNIFVKVEALLKRHDPDWAPRIIYQSSDVHNALLGPIMQKCTKRMFCAMDQATDPSKVVYCGAYAKTTEQICDFIVRGSADGARYLESDFSSNDKTQVRDVHLLEILWLRRLGAPKWLTALMLHANSFAVTSRSFGVWAKIRNQLATGAQSTTFRNTLWNASIVESFAIRHNVFGSCLVLGDDMLFRIDNPFSRKAQPIRRAYEHVVRLAHMLGKVHLFKHLSECSFLSKQFIMTCSGFVLVPKLGKAIGRFNARASVNSAVSDENYLAGKALSYSYEFRHCPPLSRAFYERYKQLAPSDGDVSFDSLGWNVRGTFLRLGVEAVHYNIFNPLTICSRDDMTRFYHYKYSMTATDVIQLVLRCLFGQDDLDVATVGRIIEDWLD